MFGYVQPKAPELLVKEYEQYKAVYCSLCSSLGKNYGRISRLTLSYDATFFAILLLALKGGCCGIEKKRCKFNPLKTCNYCVNTDDFLKLPAALSIISMRQKLKDDLHDPGFKKRVLSVLLYPLSSRPYKKACRDFPEIEEILTEMTENQAIAEKEYPSSLDMCADPTARMLSKLFEISVDDDSQKLIMQNLGYYLGKWVYLMDAADDLRDDLEKGAFNPLVNKYNIIKDSDNSEELIKAAVDECNSELNVCAANVCAAVDLLELKQFSPIINNVARLGLGNMQYEKLFKTEENSI